MPNCEPSFSRTIGMCEAKRPEAPKVTSVPSGCETISACIKDTRFSSLALGIYIWSLGYILIQPREPAASSTCNRFSPLASSTSPSLLDVWESVRHRSGERQAEPGAGDNHEIVRATDLRLWSVGRARSISQLRAFVSNWVVVRHINSNPEVPKRATIT